jgi:hypothetical protein
MEDIGDNIAPTQDQPSPSRAIEQLAAYGIRPRAERSTSDTAVSPTASLEMSETNSSDDATRRRPLFERRPYSDYGQMHRKIRVQTIAEDPSHQSTPAERTVESTAPESRHHSKSTRKSASTSSKSFDTAPVHSHNFEQSSGSDGPSQVSEPPLRPGLGRTWSRTKSGSVWYERLRNSPDKSKDSLPATISEVAPQLLVPLTPPKATPDLKEDHQHHGHLVRVEKSFTRVKEAEKPVETSSPTSRKSSINPRRLFSVPLQLVRRFSFTKGKSKVSSPRSLSPVSSRKSQHLADHKSLIKRDRTSDALRRVNSLLQETKIVANSISPVSVVNRLQARSMSEKSSSSRGSALAKFRTSSKRGSADDRKWLQPGSEDISRDNFETASYTSSQLALRMGAQPLNTPDERATYNIKRSPSAETEEFLKVDISIRGGTSYLPSEARRIHTPPLPQDGLDGRKRGFFFDYNAPRRSEVRPEEALDPAAIPIRSASRTSTSIGKRAYLDSAGRIVTKPKKTNDWYDVKLAQLEESEDDASIRVKKQQASPRLSPPPAYAEATISASGRERSTTQVSLSEIRKRKEEETLDMSIPEHLPSSPLCPRHPKYWRIVKGRGSQFRGCWMHGIGVWDDPVNFR